MEDIMEATRDIHTDETLECLSALADRQRVRIVSLLTQGEYCACELTELLGVRQNTLSHHMKVLRDEQIVLTRKKPSDQRWVYYRLNPQKLRLLAELFGDWVNQVEARLPRDVKCPLD